MGSEKRESRTGGYYDTQAEAEKAAKELAANSGGRGSENTQPKRTNKG